MVVLGYRFFVTGGPTHDYYYLITFVFVLSLFFEFYLFGVRICLQSGLLTYRRYGLSFSDDLIIRAESVLSYERIYFDATGRAPSGFIRVNLADNQSHKPESHVDLNVGNLNSACMSDLTKWLADAAQMRG